MEKKDLDILSKSNIELHFWVNPEEYWLKKEDWDRLFFTYMRFLDLERNEVEYVYDVLIDNSIIYISDWTLKEKIKLFPSWFIKILNDLYYYDSLVCFMKVLINARNRNNKFFKLDNEVIKILTQSDREYFWTEKNTIKKSLDINSILSWVDSSISSLISPILEKVNYVLKWGATDQEAFYTYELEIEKLKWKECLECLCSELKNFIDSYFEQISVRVENILIFNK